MKRWLTLALGNISFHCVVATTLSSRFSTNASSSLPFLHVKQYPLNPKSTKPQWRSVCQNSSIGAIGLRTPPFFSSEAKISLKSPKQIQGRDARAWGCLISLHVSVLRCPSGWPYIPVNLHNGDAYICILTSLWFGK